MRKRLARIASAGAAFIPKLAMATSTGGTLPWDTPLQNLKNDITGPVAFTIALLAMVAAGAVLIHRGELDDFVRRLLLVVMVAAFLVGVVNFTSALGITSAIV
jgi:type IV secretion system protein TrbC